MMINKAMDRRAAIRSLLMLTGGVVTFGMYQRCGNPTRGELLEVYPDLGIGGQERTLVLDVCERIIPVQQDGLVDIGVGDFVLLQANDGLPSAECQQFVAGLRALDAYTEIKVTNANSFADLSSSQAEVVLEDALKADASGEWADVRYFVAKAKQWTIEGYTTSRYFMTEVMPYVMAPGKFLGKVAIAPGEKINIYG